MRFDIEAQAALLSRLIENATLALTAGQTVTLDVQAVLDPDEAELFRILSNRHAPGIRVGA